QYNFEKVVQRIWWSFYVFCGMKYDLKLPSSAQPKTDLDLVFNHMNDY
ncbi:3229_t:CDS:2, partial [Acaulospora colombiana]